MGFLSSPAMARWGWVFALIAAFGFSLKAIFIKLAYPYGVDAVTLLALRMIVALPVFLWVGLHEHRSGASLTPGDWMRLLMLGLLGYYGASVLDFLGLQYISAGLERLILFTYPTLIILIGVLFQGKRVTQREIWATVLCYAGIALAFMHDLSFGETSAVLIGGGFVFASGVCYALYLSGSATMITRLGAMRFTALAMLVSTAGTLAHFFIDGHTLSALLQPAPVLGLASAMGIFCTVVPVFAQSIAIRHVGAGHAALMGMIGPLLTIAFGWWWLGEAMSLVQVAGAAFVVLGILVVTRRN